MTRKEFIQQFVVHNYNCKGTPAFTIEVAKDAWNKIEEITSTITNLPPQKPVEDYTPF